MHGILAGATRMGRNRLILREAWAYVLLLAAGLWLMPALAPAQTFDSPNTGPFRTTSEGADARLMLEGHDPVGYFVANAAVKGDPNIKTDHLGVTYRFASEENKAAFLETPTRYMPQFGGFCTNGINYAVPWGGGGSANTWRIYRGKLYVFGGEAPRNHFEMATERNLAMAHRLWNERVAGSNAWLTRWWHLIFRVPHYRTDKSLQQEWESRLAAKTLPVMPGAAQVVPAK
jgi:YHS domain-containing protein